ncbi:hypothetical protein Q7A53_21110 [Halobacillus rhizosphaerae]|uniref:ABC-three component system middle component 2 n=1 Tax=Halobacillus rhizosphaerae TaxID=3064889 RepID=UPI00398AF2C0
MIKELNLVNSDLILNSSRVLILISKFESKKKFKLNTNKIMLFDFYMKFPNTMLPNEDHSLNKEDFNEYYSYFHWQPNFEEYQLYIRFLLSKNLVERITIENDFCYRINQQGIEALKSIKTPYSIELHKIAEYIKKEISNLSEAKIEKSIIEMSLKKDRNDKNL